MSENTATTSAGRRHRRSFRRGEWVEVRGLAEIQATLDAEGRLEGMPFMREMAKFCGRKFQVARRAERVFLDRVAIVAELNDAVFLDGPRCDGQEHDGCQMKCQLFWKEAWLKPSAPPAPGEQPAVYPELISLSLPTRQGERFICQATELVRATRPLPWWNLRQYWREIMLGESTVGEVAASFWERGKKRAARWFQRKGKTDFNRQPQPTPTETLDLKPGEWVEVKSPAEINKTLDNDEKNRGLGFATGQAEFCGKRFRVAGRIEKVIIEWTGEMKAVNDTVALEDVFCHGRMCRSCPRSCYYLWREIWLRRAGKDGE
jgi:hypothetical protein